jgi:hypothetical protein
MGYKFILYTFHYYFSQYVLLFGHEFKLLALIQQDVMAIISLDDPNVWT